MPNVSTDTGILKHTTVNGTELSFCCLECVEIVFLETKQLRCDRCLGFIRYWLIGNPAFLQPENQDIG